MTDLSQMTHVKIGNIQNVTIYGLASCYSLSCESVQLSCDVTQLWPSVT